MIWAKAWKLEMLKQIQAKKRNQKGFVLQYADEMNKINQNVQDKENISYRIEASQFQVLRLQLKENTYIFTQAENFLS